MIQQESPGMDKSRVYKVLSNREVVKDLFIIKIEKKAMNFRAGQFLIIGFPNDPIKREYSIYSASSVDYIEVLLRRVPGGDVSERLSTVDAGDLLTVDGPAGEFFLPDDYRSKRILFVASGTGISPFHSFIQSYPELDYRLIHGVRTLAETEIASDLKNSLYTSCISREDSGDYQGRVTQFLKDQVSLNYDLVYLCGNGNMVYDSYQLLSSRGFQKHQLFTEIFF